MNKIYFLTVTFSILINSLFGQNVTKETFEKAVDKLNCLASKYSTVDNEKSWKCDCQKNPSYDTISKNIPSALAATIALSREINKIKTEINPPKTKEELIKTLHDDVFELPYKFEALSSFHKKHKGKDVYVQWQNQLTIELEELISNSSQQANSTSQVSSDVAKPATADQNSSSENNRSGDIPTPVFTFELDVIALMCIMALGIVLYKITYSKKTQPSSSKKTEISQFEKNYVNQQINDLKNQYFHGSSANSSAEIKRLKEDISQLQQDILSLKEYINSENNEKRNSSKKDSDTNPAQSDTIPRSNQENIYLSQPNEDGSFDNSAASPEFRKSASIFRFTKKTQTTATFQIESQESAISLALQFRQKTINPVCESENEFETHFKKIITIEPGQTKLEGNKWKVTQKARIRYEN